MCHPDLGQANRSFAERTKAVELIPPAPQNLCLLQQHVHYQQNTIPRMSFHQSKGSTRRRVWRPKWVMDSITSSLQLFGKWEPVCISVKRCLQCQQSWRLRDCIINVKPSTTDSARHVRKTVQTARSDKTPWSHVMRIPPFVKWWNDWQPELHGNQALLSFILSSDSRGPSSSQGDDVDCWCFQRGTEVNMSALTTLRLTCAEKRFCGTVPSENLHYHCHNYIINMCHRTFSLGLEIT